MERSLLHHERVLINAGQRGTMLCMAPQAIARALDALVEEIGE
jgi:prolyl-tRNA editing enzyme YbaK/EbsC (Cys-tRNA(Pro) deacylase)